MSLKFGIFLVEHQIVSSAQFCGLVKMQQEALASLPSLALRKNDLTIRQVATLLDMKACSPHCSFIELAIENGFLDRVAGERLLTEQAKTSHSMMELVVRTGLLTQRQVDLLFEHFRRLESRRFQERRSSSDPEDSLQGNSSADRMENLASPPFQRVDGSPSIRRPKFQQLPMMVVAPGFGEGALTEPV
ncbi:MAG: hypothetical protein MK106_07640 [Mariniblastus sp.]|nr:hypothetical protein [Mariniblastus sp.]